MNSSKENLALLVIAWAFILNTFWEFGQCIFLYNMWSWPFWEATLWMWGALFGDILIVLALWKGVVTLFPTVKFSEGGSRDYSLLVILSFAASILLEWAAIYLDLWTYDRSMPTLLIFGYKVGLSPILQITFLPALSIYPSHTVPFTRLTKSRTS